MTGALMLWRRPPIDVVKLAGDLGMRVYRTDLPPGTRASVFRDPELGVLTIHLNRSDAWRMQRWSCAHAVSLAWRGQDRPDFGHVVRSRHLTPTGGDDESQLANQFAAAVLDEPL